jgi:hypothetical protein
VSAKTLGNLLFVFKLLIWATYCSGVNLPAATSTPCKPIHADAKLNMSLCTPSRGRFVVHICILRKTLYPVVACKCLVIVFGVPTILRCWNYFNYVYNLSMLMTVCSWVKLNSMYISFYVSSAWESLNGRCHDFCS